MIFVSKKPDSTIPHTQSLLKQKMLLAALEAEQQNEKHKKFQEHLENFQSSVTPKLDEVSPPITNRGGKVEDRSLPSFQALEHLEFVSVGKGGMFKTITIPKPDTSKDIRHSFVDWITFTFRLKNFPLHLDTGAIAETELDFIHSLSAVLYDVFGFGITSKRASGLNFYESSYDLGKNGWGFVCIGGQNGTCSVTVKGQGLMSSEPGWEQRLYDLLIYIPQSTITRIDLASDNFNSKLTVDDYLDMYKADMFMGRGRNPNVEQAGNWINPNGKGRTLYIGNRKSGKLLRIYEKGLQLANGFHETFPHWLRVELELKNQDRVIPYETLLRPGQYLAGAYPALADLYVVQEVIKTHKNTAKSTFQKAIAITNHQFGKYIWTAAQILGVEKAFELLTKDKAEIPTKLDFDTFEQFEDQSFLHQFKLTPTLTPVPF